MNPGLDSEQHHGVLPARELLMEHVYVIVMPVVFSADKFSGWMGEGLGTNAGVDREHDPRLLPSRDFSFILAFPLAMRLCGVLILLSGCRSRHQCWSGQ